jgi:predicted AlkP superfamily pyrophosphatase or phosphodiesterase
VEIALADVVPSLLAGLDVPGMVDVVGLPRARRVCLLLVDGLGWHLLRDHADDAPFLASLAGGPISTGFPSTTATSIASLGTGLASGEHGLVGYSFAADGVLLNALGWNQHGVTPSADLRAVVVPEELQPRQTALERAAEAGVEVRVVAPYEQRRSGLTRAVLRGGRFEGVFALGDLTTAAIAALQADRAFCYAYHADLDKLGHVHGPGSDPWRLQLTYVDRLAELIVARLPSDGLLAVTGDHGMVAIGEDDRIDFDTEPLLQAGVRMLGGEARARYLYTEPGAVDAVAETWQGVLGDRAQVMRRDDAIEAGWFGPTVADHVRPRIGDLVVAMRGTSVVVRSAAEPLLSRFAGHHGSFTAAEQLVPLLHKM